MLTALGSPEVVTSSADNPCCDVCDPHLSSDHIVHLQPVLLSARRPRRRRVRVVTADKEKTLEEMLMKERDDIAQKHPGFQMLGSEFVISSAVIKSICKDVSFIDSVEYLKERYSVRPELCDNLFRIIENVVCTPSANKKPCT